MRACPVVMRDVVGKYPAEVAPATNEQLIKALPPHGPYPSLRKRICLGGTDSGLYDPDTLGSKDLVEGARELGVPVADQKAPVEAGPRRRGCAPAGSPSQSPGCG
jgi:hypothetical protein